MTESISSDLSVTVVLALMLETAKEIGLEHDARYAKDEFLIPISSGDRGSCIKGIKDLMSIRFAYVPS